MLCYKAAVGHAVEPGPGPIIMLQILQLIKAFAQAVVHLVRIEQMGELLLLLLLIQCIQNPRGFRQYNLFKFMVLFQNRSKRAFQTQTLPLFKYLPYLRVFLDYKRSQLVGIQVGKNLIGAFVFGFHQIR